MSIEVELADLGRTLQDYPWGFLVSTGDDGTPRALGVPTTFVDGSLRVAAGRSTVANVAARPTVTVLCPGADGGAYSLIIDGTAVVDDDQVIVTPTWAVLHRPALARRT